MLLPKVSITVPVYNVEQGLTRCLESLINQTLKEIEIIVVDDGSTDNSGQICDEYARKDSRIKVIHKPNGGLASARQVALELVRGEYYTVCDSDDWVEPDMYKDMYNRAIEEGADMVLSDHYVNYPNGRELISQPYNYTYQDEYVLDIMFHKAPAQTWSKLFRLDMLKSRNIGYVQGINLGEDALFLLKVLQQPLKIVSVDRCYYHYHRDMNSSSYTNNITLKGVEQNRYIWHWRITNYSDKRYDKAHYYSLLNLSFTALRAVDITSKEFRAITKDVSITRITKYNLWSPKAILIITTKMFGLKFGRLILRSLYRFFYR